ncbi:MAG: hypothetical protein QOI98_1313 [Solirubrobacteraceae bacterium]|jgi:hypothetical protein|nr:hypothetical protein [Solirubrobacteraceae bacterium]
MTTFAPDQDTDSDPRRQHLEERKRAAWGEYSASLQDLKGQEYDDAEHRSWERLQRRLDDIERRGSQLSSTSTGPRST